MNGNCPGLNPRRGASPLKPFPSTAPERGRERRQGGGRNPLAVPGGAQAEMSAHTSRMPLRGLHDFYRFPRSNYPSPSLLSVPSIFI